MNKTKLLLISSVISLILLGCSQQGSKTSAEIDDVELQVTRTDIQQTVAYEVDPGPTGGIGAEVSVAFVHVIAEGYVNEMEDLEKIKEWDVQLFDDTEQEFKLNEIKFSILDTVDGDNNTIHFEVNWIFFGYMKSESFTFYLPQNNVIQLDELVEISK